MQEVIGSTPIFSTQSLNVLGVQLFSNTPGTNYTKTLPQHANFSGMESAEITYTTMPNDLDIKIIKHNPAIF